ncbi:uncharacterized protein ASCRUDRAFT_106923 [Ascoidea rubescens DSM 1968]|uniref:Uncharacterized protein n=1 Tax=Ascoidea rubescens DSM 1968 TaxID=1344418 RepID=A0A1D2VE42_9ASCO|nr:hypothetical protein ASCRUDRAFT_106923 [Ascoidea rubescens DSM 1968]ODV59780.1 hypothetical protein ASCRUDRAFT_106923 [Ascoidea rubescens DSM 1968]
MCLPDISKCPEKPVWQMPFLHTAGLRAYAFVGGCTHAYADAELLHTVCGLLCYLMPGGHLLHANRLRKRAGCKVGRCRYVVQNIGEHVSVKVNATGLSCRNICEICEMCEIYVNCTWNK